MSQLAHIFRCYLSLTPLGSRVDLMNEMLRALLTKAFDVG